MRDIWFTSDTHFSHKGILNFTMEDGSLVRPEFSSVEEMDEFMIQEWNKVVKPSDYIYHLGDMYMGDPKKFQNFILSRLNGHIRVLLGNHDDGKIIAQMNKIKKLGAYRRFDEHNFVCSHKPLHKFSRYNHRKNLFMVNVHGHLHKHNIPEEEGYFNICVENTEYRPLNMSEIIKKVKEII